VLSVLAALSLAGSPLLVGTSDVDITPPEPLPLGGYTERGGRVMDPGGDRLHARALVVRRDPFRVAIVSVEILTIPESLRFEVVKRIPADVRLLLCATHTHCAPDSQMLNDRMTLSIPGIASFKRRWLTWYSDRIGEAINKALEVRPQPVSELDVESWRADLNRGRRKRAKPDQTASLVEAAKGAALLFEYAAHGTFYDSEENRTRGDWPGGVTALAPMALIGPIGDVSPRAPGLDKASGAEKVAAFWKAMAAGRTHAARRRDWEPKDSVGWGVEPIELGKPIPSPAATKAYSAFAQTLVTRFAPTSASVSVLRLGKLAIVGIPGEPTSVLGRRIGDFGHKLGLRDVLVLSHCNGWIGYILSGPDYDDGGYEATLSFYGRDEGDRVVKAAEAALHRAASP